MSDEEWDGSCARCGEILDIDLQERGSSFCAACDALLDAELEAEEADVEAVPEAVSEDTPPCPAGWLKDPLTTCAQPGLERNQDDPPEGSRCYYCDGEGMVQCTTCRGRGGRWAHRYRPAAFYHGPLEGGFEWDTCSSCAGTGREECPEYNIN